jgi:hypothetical protein
MFSIELHNRDIYILNNIQKFFKVGNITIRNQSDKSSIIYSVQSIKDINNVIIPHFLKYPLLTQKQIDFKLFCLIMDLINKKEHLSLEGIGKIINIRASMNKKLIDRFNKDFPNIKPFIYSFIANIDINDPH